ncbi:DUF4397 domain-containing protein [Haloimpatiens sp. FM7330]|uniref:DUF4397 domain-containing protein n=1 Tax=Haloimpatiens sp. FM7330 TaxID=3298610 RepID=UPI0036405967
MYSPFFRMEPSITYVRILHASPDAPPVDIYINNKLVVRRLSYKNFTEYLPLPSKIYNIKVFPTGTTDNPVINTNVFLPEEKIFTAAAIGPVEDISLKLIPEPRKPINPNKVMVRFIHLSPDAPPVDITLPDGTKIFDDVEYKEVTDYIEVDPGVYKIQAKIAGTDDVVLTVPRIHLKPNKFYSIYAVGFADGKPPLQVLIPLDGNTYLNF